MRTLHELYCILWGEVKDRDLPFGIGHEFDVMLRSDKITCNEYFALISHFRSQKPSENQHTDFTKHPSWIGEDYLWNEKETSERKRFIKLMIEITK